jgi:hypothetical protein
MTLVGAYIPEVSSKIIYCLYIISTGLFVYIFMTVSVLRYEKTEEFQEYFLG